MAGKEQPKEKMTMTGKTLALVAGKGGVGKTTLTANIGASLARDFRQKTVVVDGNFLTSNLGIHFGLIEEPVSLHDVLAGKIEVEQALYPHSSGLKILPSALRFDAKLVHTDLTKVIAHLQKDYDYIVVDSSPGLNKETMSVVDACDHFLVVVNPETPSVVDSMKTIQMLEDRRKSILGIVLNKSRGKKYELSKDDIEETTGYPVVMEIPYDEAVPMSIANKTPAVLLYPNSIASIRMRKLTGKIVGKNLRLEEGLLARIMRFIFG